VSELPGIVAGVLEDLDRAGALADYLDEHGDPRGVLLRRRWKRWRKERAAAVEMIRAEEERIGKPFLDLLTNLRKIPGATVEVGGFTVRISRAIVDDKDDVFRGYIWERFAAEVPQEQPQ
jgi:hypothetical protein